MTTTAIPARALHYVLKIGDRAKNAFFFRNILGMKVLRHEEFTEGCDAQCNGPYDNRWSKTMIGYGEEDCNFVLELTYNYGVKSYKLGNDFGGIKIKSQKVIERAQSNNYPITEEDGLKVLISPDGYKFFVIEKYESTVSDTLAEVILNTNNLKESKKYWNELLNMLIISEEKKSVLLCYPTVPVHLRIQEISDTLDRAKAYGRIAFAVPFIDQPRIEEKIKAASRTILTPLTSLDTPGKATVRVIILADPNGHEICFVDEEGFHQLSQVDPDSNASLDKYIAKDPFQEK